MRLAQRIALVAIVALLSMPVLAHEVKLGALVIDHAWIKMPPMGAEVAGGYMTITNTGADADRLIAASSDIAEMIQLHTVTMQDDVMKMVELKDGIEIPAGGTVELKPKSLHLMFMELKHPLVEHATVAGTLTFEKAGTVAVEFEVEPMGADGSNDGMDMMDGGQ
jgi:copper(I)-binding protein